MDEAFARAGGRRGDLACPEGLRGGRMKRKDFLSQDTFESDSGEDIVVQKSARMYCAGMPRIEAHGKSKSFARKVLGIGRDRSNAVIVADPEVSKFHAIFSLRKGTAFIRDTGSTNGTWVNGDRIPPGKNVELRDRDVLMLGSTRILILYRP